MDRRYHPGTVLVWQQLFLSLLFFHSVHGQSFLSLLVFHSQLLNDCLPGQIHFKINQDSFDCLSSYQSFSPSSSLYVNRERTYHGFYGTSIATPGRTAASCRVSQAVDFGI
jgi:hypothetical protein